MGGERVVVARLQLHPRQARRITSLEETRDALSTIRDFTYDDAGRLQTVTEDGLEVASYAWDPNGNRLSVTRDGVEEFATTDEQDRLITNGDFTYAFNADGQLSTRTNVVSGESTTFTYDSMGRLQRVDLPDGRVVTYVLDGYGRRLSKIVDDVVEHFIYDEGQRIIGELDASGTLIRRYLYATRPNVPDVVLDLAGGHTWRVVHDHLGSPRMVVDADNGTLVAERRWDEFGVPLVDTTPGLLPFGFAGGLEDRDTGLLRFGARDYEPASGRWTTKDPIGFAGGDTNIYAYVAGDPVNRLDVSGLADDFADVPAAGDFFRDLGEIFHESRTDASVLFSGLGVPVADAIGHCAASCTAAKKYGVAWTSIAAQSRESLELTNQPPGNVGNDLINNICGIQAAASDDTQSCMTQCYQAHAEGRLSERADTQYPAWFQGLLPVERWIRNLAMAL